MRSNPFPICAGTLLLMISPQFACSSVLAGTVAIQIQGSDDNYFGPFMGGWSFELSSPVQVDALGFFDKGNDGLFEEHEVGIWDSTGANLLTSGTVPAGTAGELEQSFRFVSVGQVTLSPDIYVIGGFGGFNPASIDDPMQEHATIATADSVTFIENRATNVAVPGLTYPPDTFSGNCLGSP